MFGGWQAGVTAHVLFITEQDRLGHKVPGQTKVEAAWPLDALAWNSLDVTSRSKSLGQPQF